MKITPEQLAACGTEHGEQAALFCWANDNKHLYPELGSMFAIPNGGQRNPATAARLKAEGVKVGVSDIFLPAIRAHRERVGGHIIFYHGLFIEKKRIQNSYATPEQAEFIKLMKSRGYCATVCRGWLEAKEVIISYLTLPG